MQNHRWVATLLLLGTLTACRVEYAPMPPEGHVFLTVQVVGTDANSGMPDCLISLEPLFSNSPAPRASSGTTNAEGILELVQPHGNYQLFVECPGKEPPDPRYVELDGAPTYSTMEVLGSKY